MNTKWTIDQFHSEIGFKVKHMMISNVSGNFSNFQGEVQTASNDFSNAEFNFSAAVDSINTGVVDRDNHLKSDDFFNAEKFPQLVFKSTEVIKKGENDYQINGEMTIRDTTKAIQINAEISDIVVDPYGQTKAGLSFNGKIKRSEFGLKWNAITEAGNIVVSDEIKLNGELQFIKQ